MFINNIGINPKVECGSNTIIFQKSDFTLKFQKMKFYFKVGFSSRTLSSGRVSENRTLFYPTLG